MGWYVIGNRFESCSCSRLGPFWDHFGVHLGIDFDRFEAPSWTHFWYFCLTGGGNKSKHGNDLFLIFIRIMNQVLITYMFLCCVEGVWGGSFVIIIPLFGTTNLIILLHVE